ncbi:MAG TPA: diguanylate cyclase [Spirochaetota bacterium]|nr:diguanylate cyclase [Spirochaetota bacterium]
MKKNIIIVCIVWFILTGLSAIWNSYNIRRDQDNLVLQVARTNFQQVLLFRAWNSIHGGVYVPVTADTSPNPYLDTEMREIKVNRDLTLTKINPAFMTRQVSEIAAKREGIRFRITSLNPLRPENRPTPLEKTALEKFEKGIPETGERVTDDGKLYYFYMAELRTEKACLKCHAKQGYREGDIRGGISVIMPYEPRSHIMWLILGHTVGLVAGLWAIVFWGMRLDRAYSTIRHQSLFDALTGIPNRRSFSERIMQEFNRSRRDNQPLSIIMGDIDHFKQYNDNYGHSMGDDCLRRVAQAINNTLKRPGDFCARYGGEEFIIILPNTAVQGAVSIAEDIRRNVFSLDIPHEKSEAYKKVSISLGVAGDENNQFLSHEDLLKMADDALYMAKEKGRNRCEVNKK